MVSLLTRDLENLSTEGSCCILTMYLTMSVASLCKRGSRSHFALPVSNDSGESLTLTHINSFRGLVEEMEIHSVSLSKTEKIRNVPWNYIATWRSCGV